VGLTVARLLARGSADALLGAPRESGTHGTVAADADGVIEAARAAAPSLHPLPGWFDADEGEDSNCGWLDELSAGRAVALLVRRDGESLEWVVAGESLPSFGLLGECSSHDLVATLAVLGGGDARDGRFLLEDPPGDETDEDLTRRLRQLYGE
jgi:hypothetical protein